MHKKKYKTWAKHFDFIFLDFVFIEFSFLLSYILRFGARNVDDLVRKTSSAGPYRYMMLIIAVMHLAILVFAEPYSNILKRNSADEAKKVLQYNVYMVLGIILLLFMSQSSQTYSRIVVFIFPVIGFVLIYTYRYFYKKYLQRNINKAENQSCMLLVAPYHKIGTILREFNNRQISTSRIVGIILTDDYEAQADLSYAGQALNEAAATDEISVSEDGQTVIDIHKYRSSGKQNIAAPDQGNDIVPSEQNYIQDIPIVGTLETMYDYASENVVDEVLLYMEGDAAYEVVTTFMSMGIVVHVSIRNLVQVPNATINRINGIPVVTASVNNVTTRQLMIKRLIDIFFGLIGSIATVLLTIIIAPLMMIADPGPIFFRQERVGRNGRTFKIWKFRTMYKDAEARKAELMSQNKMSGLMFKMDDDPRIIGYGKKFSLGKFLRETSLDEMPQSFNILAGSMSVVGTRPPTLSEYQQYELRHKGRLAMMPGLTGMWQVSGRSDITDFEEVVKLDKEYIENFSLMLDLEIILKTFKVVLGREGSV